MMSSIMSKAPTPPAEVTSAAKTSEDFAKERAAILEKRFPNATDAELEQMLIEDLNSFGQVLGAQPPGSELP